MDIKLFDYELDKNLIAQFPASPRESAKLLFYDRKKDEIKHLHISDLPNLLPIDSLLIRNSSKVIPARLRFQLPNKDKLCEILLHQRLDDTKWSCLVSPGKYFQVGNEFHTNKDFPQWQVLEILESGERLIETNLSELQLYELIERYGQMPLPPYIDKFDGDTQDYQTPFGKTPGSVATPTASLHFTHGLVEKIESSGVTFADVLLHVGLGTFQPVKTANVQDHAMHGEFYSIPKSTKDLIKEYKSANKPIIAIGTTALRALESWERYKEPDSEIHETKIFLKPGDDITSVNGLLTNFHLPKSTLIMLVACLISQGQSPEYGIQKTQEIYKEAIDNKYRFYSFGDAMLIL